MFRAFLLRLDRIKRTEYKDTRQREKLEKQIFLYIETDNEGHYTLTFFLHTTKTVSSAALFYLLLVTRFEELVAVYSHSLICKCCFL